MKPSWGKTVRNFLVANLCALVPLWMAVFGGMPDQVRVHLRVEGKRPVLLLANATTLLGKDMGVKRGGRIWSFSLREGTEWQNLEFVLPGDLGPESVRRIEWKKWRAFVLYKKGGGLVQTDAASNRYAFPEPRFDSAGFASGVWAAGVLGVELLLLFLSWFFAGRHREEPVKRLLPPVLGVALALGLLLQAVLPLQSFLANRSAFPFSLAELGVDMAVRFGLFSGIGALLLLLLTRCFGRPVLAAVLAFAVCLHLEAGVLSIGLPDMKGDWTFFGNRFRACWDAGVWVGVFAVFLGCHPFLKRHYGVASLCATALFCASLLDVKVEPKADASRFIVRGFSPIETVVRSVKYSASGNVLVFVIDSLEQGLAHAIMEDPAEGAWLKEKFSGFTEYLGNVGGGNTSLLAVSNVLTGDFPDNASVFDYFASIYSERSVLKDFMDAGYEISMATTSHGYGYSSRATGAEAAAGRADCFRVPSTAGNAWTLEGFDRFRCLPFGAKASYAERVELNAPVDRFSDREWTVYPILRDAEVLPGERGTFLFVHTEGVHIPILLDRTGARLEAPRMSDEACVEMGVFVMKQLGGLFDAYREKGIYDNSMIVVMSDHGPHTSSYEDGELPDKARPFLWIKPVGAAHAFRTSRLPTGHAQLAGLLRAASRKTLTEGEIEELIQADVRRYFWLRAGMGPEYKDYLVDREGRVSIVPGTLAESVESMRPPETGRTYLLGCHDMGRNGLDIVFHDVDFWPCPKWDSGTAGFSFFFRAPEPGKRYSLTLSALCEKVGTKLAPDAVIEWRQTNPRTEWMPLRALRKMKIVLHGLRPASDGKVEIEFRRGASFTTDAEFHQLTLEEEPDSAPDGGT